VKRVVALALLVVACRGSARPLRVGAKSFDEQRVLAAAIVQLVRATGRRAQRVDCGDTFSCQDAIRGGEVDVLVEYSGTALRLGGVPLDEANDAETLRALYAPLGLRWGGGLGFDNAYRVVVPRRRATELRLAEIGHLARIEGGVRVACPAHYRSRPGDGLFPLMRRYGLRLSGPPVILDDPGERYAALREGRVDVAIGYATDGALDDRGLQALADPLSFFPEYEGAVLTRQDVLDSDPELEDVLSQLEGLIDTREMRHLNARVQLEGQEPSAVARELLLSHSLLEEQRDRRRAELLVVAHEDDALDVELSVARRAARRAFPDHEVRTELVRAPVARLVSGEARLAVIGAERFFVSDEQGNIRRETRIEAVGALGMRMLHLVAREGSPRRIGLPPRTSGAARIGRAILASRGVEPATYAHAAELLEQVADGGLDGALLLAQAPDARISRVLEDHPELRLVPIRDWLSPADALRLPHVRRTRLPSDTYPNQGESVDTLGVQLVLAAPQASDRAIHTAGPGAALRTSGVPLSDEEVSRLATATGHAERPDPSLPSPWSLAPEPGDARGAPTRVEAIVDTSLNVLLWIYLAWLVWLGVERRPRASSTPDQIGEQ